MSRTFALNRFIAEQGLDAILITDPMNRRYYSGFTGSTGYLLLLPAVDCFVADFRYVTQAKEQCHGFDILSIDPVYTLFDLLRRHHIVRLGVEENSISVAFARQLRDCGVTKLVGVDAIPRRDRQIKDAEELNSIQRACEITDRAFEHLLGRITVGMTEWDIDMVLRSFMQRESGVERMADTFIVASGERGCMPHGVATNKKIQKGELITIDFGCNYRGYWSDVTRTVCVGGANDWQREIYGYVLEAQQRAITEMCAGKAGRELHLTAWNHIDAAGYGKQFGHGLGHSFGLDIHESPRCALTTEGDILLEAGMIMTVEPGIYIEGKGGVRIEDDVVITAEGCRLLSHCNRQLIELY